MAAEYHWTARYVEAELTDELLVMLLDAAYDRRADHAQADFASMVEAVRAGSIFATSSDGNRQHARWQADSARRAGRRAAGKDLAQLARDFGGLVERGGFEFRES